MAKRIGEVQCELIMRGRDLDYINRFMLRFFGPSKAKDGEYRTTTAWYMSDLRKKGFDIAKRERKTKEQKMEKLLRLAEKYGIKVTVEAADAAEATPVAPQATAPIAPQMVAVPVAAPDNENNG